MGYRRHAPRRRGIQYVSGILDHPPSRVMTSEGILATHCARGLPETSRPPIRGRREDRVLAAPAVPRAICANKTAHEHTGQRQHSGLPCAMALRLTSCSPRRTALLPPSPPRSFASLGLSASTAAPEPHDFAVRPCSSVRAQKTRLSKSVHRIPRPTCRDDHDTPLLWARDGEAYNSDFQKCEVKYFCEEDLTQTPKNRSDLPAC